MATLQQEIADAKTESGSLGRQLEAQVTTTARQLEDVLTKQISDLAPHNLPV